MGTGWIDLSESRGIVEFVGIVGDEVIVGIDAVTRRKYLRVVRSVVVAGCDVVSQPGVRSVEGKHFVIVHIATAGRHVDPHAASVIEGAEGTSDRRSQCGH